MDAQELLSRARAKCPHRRFAMSTGGLAIGVFDPLLARFVIVFAKAPDGTWYHIPVEILINGFPPVIEWIE